MGKVARQDGHRQDTHHSAGSSVFSECWECWECWTPGSVSELRWKSIQKYPESNPVISSHHFISLYQIFHHFARWLGMVSSRCGTARWDRVKARLRMTRALWNAPCIWKASGRSYKILEIYIWIYLIPFYLRIYLVFINLFAVSCVGSLCFLISHGGPGGQGTGAPLRFDTGPGISIVFN